MVWLPGSTLTECSCASAVFLLNYNQHVLSLPILPPNKLKIIRQYCCCTDVIVMLKWMEIMAKTMEISCNKPELFFKSQTKRVSVHMILLFSCYGYNAQAIAHIRTPGKKNPNPDSRAYREQFFHFEIKLHSVHTVWPTLTHGVLKQQRLPAWNLI